MPTDNKSNTATQNGALVACKFTPSVAPSKATLTWCKRQIITVRNDLLNKTKQIRAKSALSARRVRDKHRKLGYQEGLEQGRQAAVEALIALQSSVASYHDNSESRLSSMAKSLAEKIIEQELRSDETIYQRWISEAVALFPTSSPLKLHYSSTFRPLLQILACESSDEAFAPTISVPNIAIEEDPTLPTGTMQILSPLGSVEFAWKEVLDSIVIRHHGARC